MDLVASCKDKLAQFRVKELKDVLTLLNLSKQGRKQDHIDRIVAFLSDESVSRTSGGARKIFIPKEGIAKIIDDTYRKMQMNGAVDLTSNGHGNPNINSKSEAVDNSFQLDMIVYCPCGSSLFTDSMIKCGYARCHIWQHRGCVVPENLAEDVPAQTLHQFYCATCRINFADPFCMTLSHPLLPLRLAGSPLSADGTSQKLSVERTFQLTKSESDLLQKTECDLQVWCILLNDKVRFRMHWPQFSEIQVNGIPIRTTNRSSSQLLGANGRDAGPIITAHIREGINKISLSRCDARVFCIGVRILKRRTIQQVLDMIPKESDGEHFEVALARVCRCIGGGATHGADEDSDLEVMEESITVNLRCPMSASRIKIAGRFKPCAHMGCFDLHTFVELSQHSLKWQCPICLKNYTLEQIIIDPYFNRITTKMRDCGENVNEIEIKPDGSWRAKSDNEVGQWHFPDGSICPVSDTVESVRETTEKIKPEHPYKNYSGMKQDFVNKSSGSWEFFHPEENRPLVSLNYLPGNFENCDSENMYGTASYQVGEDIRTHNSQGVRFDSSEDMCFEHDSGRLNFDYHCGVVDRIPPVSSKDVPVIVLSDSEENDVANSPEIEFNTASSIFSKSGPSNPFPNNEDVATNMSPFHGLLDTAHGDFEVHWQVPSVNPGFHLFASDANASEALVELSSSVCLPLKETLLGSTSHISNQSNREYIDLNGDLVNNPVVFGSCDPDLQIFPPSQPVGDMAHVNLSVHDNASIGVHTEDWFSLKVRSGVGDESIIPNDLNFQDQFMPCRIRMEALADTASFLRTNDERLEKASSARNLFNNFSFHPRRRRSERPRKRCRYPSIKGLRILSNYIYGHQE